MGLLNTSNKKLPKGYPLTSNLQALRVLYEIKFGLKGVKI